MERRQFTREFKLEAVRLIKQRGDGELLLVVEDRADSAQNVPNQGRRQGRRLRLHRALLQSETPALDDRIFKSYGVRAAGGISLSGCQPNRVQLNLDWRPT